MKRRLLTIGHSYCVTLNRRLADEMARLGDWDVTAVGPARFRGDFGWHTLEPSEGEACTAVAVPVRFGTRIHLMRYGRELTDLLQQRWDLVHCWEEPYVTAAFQVARAVAPNVPLVFATFQNIAKRYPPPFSMMERYSMSRAHGVVAFGQTVADVMVTRGFDQKPVAVIPPGVDVTVFRPDESRRADTLASLDWSRGAPVVGFLGRLVPEKGIGVFMAALDRINTPWRALVVGSGVLEGEVAAWAARHGDRARLVSTAQHDEVPAYLNAMDVLCAPSRTTATWREQFGRMLIEAFASGVAVVASTSGEIPNVVGDSGVLVPEDDVAAWSEAIELLTTDHARRCTWARHGRDRAETVYAWPVVARQNLDFFERLIEAQAL